MLQATATLSFEGSCNDVTTDEQRSQVTSDVVQEIRATHLCNNDDILQLCNEQSYTVTCDDVTLKRRRRQANDDVIAVSIRFFAANE